MNFLRTPFLRNFLSCLFFSAFLYTGIANAAVVAWWSGDGNANDSIGGNNGTLVGNTSFTTGVSGQAFQFDGATGSVLTSTVLPMTGTIEMWVKPTSLSQPSSQVMFGTHGNTAYDRLWGAHFGPQGWAGKYPPYSISINFGNNATNDITVPTPLMEGEWTHLAVTFNYGTGAYQLYANGALIGSATVLRPMPTGRFRIGGATSSFGQNWFFNGAIDEVKIHDTILSTAEIQQSFNSNNPPQNTSPIAWWPGENNTNDVVGGNNGVLQGGTTYTNGKIGNAFLFDGSTGTVSTPFKLPAIGTIEMWVNPTSLSQPSTQVMFGTHGNTAYDRLWGANFGPLGWDGRYPPYSLSLNFGNNAINDINVPTPLTDGVWTHVAITFNYYRGEYQLYANGVLTGSASVFRPRPTGEFRIGGATSNFGQTWFFNGAIDEVKIYKRILTGAEILANSNGNTAPVANAGVTQSVLVGSSVTLNGSASSDVDGNPLTYSWTMTAPDGTDATALLSDPTAISPTFVTNMVGNYVATLIVNDGLVNSAASQVTATATNTLPVAAIQLLTALANNTAITGQPINFSASSFDPDGQSITYQWTLATPAGSATVLNGANTVNSGFTPDVLGAYTVTLVVNDGYQNSLPAVFTINVVTPAQAVGNLPGLPFVNPQMQAKLNQLINMINNNVPANAIGNFKNNTLLPRTDGCPLRGAVDLPPPPPTPFQSDWVTSCGSQNIIYNVLINM